MESGGVMEKVPNLGRYAIRIPTEVQVGNFYRNNQPVASANSTTKETTTDIPILKGPDTFSLEQQAIRNRAGSVVSQFTSADSESLSLPSQSNDESTQNLASQQDKLLTLESRFTNQENGARKDSAEPSVSQQTDPSIGPNSALYIDTQASDVPAVNCNIDDETHESIVVDINPVVYATTSEETTIYSQTNDNENQFSPYNPVCYTPNVPKRTKKKTYPKQGPYDKILSGVVFVMSGYENPRRSKLRDMAIEMGAKYQPVWNRFCTHLICAFKNTPKYKEVMAENGRIVREHWIQECSRQRQLIDWRNYKLGKYPYPDSEEEVDVDDLDYALRTSHRVQTTSK